MKSQQPFQGIIIFEKKGERNNVAPPILMHVMRHRIKKRCLAICLKKLS